MVLDYGRVVLWQTTKSYRQALKNSRDDDITFCSISRDYLPDVRGNGPVATTARTGKKTFYADLESARLRRSDRAKEFGIKSLGLIPIEGGVLEYGIPTNARLSGHTLAAMLKISAEACEADYSLCWSSTLAGNHLATTGSFLLPGFRQSLREKELEGDFISQWSNTNLDARSNGPVATCMQTGEPVLIPDVGGSSMKRSSLAMRFSIVSVAFIPAGGDVIEIGKVLYDAFTGIARDPLHSSVGWRELPRMALEIPVAAISYELNSGKAAHVVVWTAREQAIGNDQIVAIASYEKPEHKQQVLQIKGTDGTYVTESFGVELDRYGDGPVATALRTGRDIVLDLVTDDTSTYKRAQLAEEYGIIRERMVPTSNCVFEFGTPRNLLELSGINTSPRSILRRTSTQSTMSVEEALRGFSKGRKGTYKLGVDKSVRRDQLSSSRAMLLLYGLPLVLLLWYSSAIFLPPTAQEHAPVLFWTPGVLMLPSDKLSSANESSTTYTVPTVCPKISLCSEGTFQILLLVCARLSAFVMYLSIVHVFITKMHALNHYFVRISPHRTSTNPHMPER